MKNHVSARKLSAIQMSLISWLVCLLSTTWAGAQLSERARILRGVRNFWGFELTEVAASPYAEWQVLGDALLFSLPILLILSAHEFGHYWFARRVGVPLSFPLFLPFLPPFGTLGAVMQVEEAEREAVGSRGDSLDRVRSKSSPLEHPAMGLVGVAGPVAGAIFAFPCAFVGVSLSGVGELPVNPAPLAEYLGGLYQLWLELLIHGAPEEGHILYLHPLAFAAWAGLFLTGFNLLPVSQFDGGHILRASLPRRVSRRIEQATFLALIFLGVLVYPGWLVVAGLAWYGSPEPLFRASRTVSADDTPVSAVRKPGGYGPLVVAVILFALCFAPVPVFVPSWGVWSFVGG